ncbi:reverse transcriptase domain-containing protein [Tanacetum coccineum]
MYVDGSSASEILYEHCFSRLRSEIKNQFVPTPTPLIGFSDEIIWPIGQIQIPVKIGDEEHSTLALMNFVVVRSPSPYNGIIGRPGVKKLQAVPSTAHGMLKLLVEGGVITLKSSRMVPLECAVDSGPEGNFPATKQAVEERIKLAINPKYPKQTGCSPVRQKKRRQAADRNQAIQEEVGKLVGAGIMKEVYYHDWLSNLVMVKKHDDSWRMCVDFKDLNKAFLKDGYPLPEIDWKISRNLEVYVDDLVIKSHTEDEIVRDIEEMFKTLREINMKLNPKKCTFGIEEGMFLGYKVSTRGLKVCPDKVNAILSLPSPKCLKDVQKLNGKLASLNRFLAKSAEKSLPFFKPLKKFMKKSDFHWIAEAEKAFKQMKRLITELLMLVAPMEKEELIVYLAAAKETVSAVLMTERETKQMSIYFVSRALKGPEVNYTSMEKLVMALVHASKRLKRYFQAHPIIVITDQPIQQVLSRPEVAGRLQKWSIELGEYAIHYRPRVSVKGQILADFIVERPEEDSPDTLMEVEEALPEPWILFTDGSSCTDGFGAGLILTNPEGMEFTYALRFRFDATNNEAEYEALIAGLRITEQMGVKNLQANVDSRLVANQVNGTYVAKEADMIRYVEKVRALTSSFKAFAIRQVPRSENKKADALSKIASTSFAHLSKQVLVEELQEKSIGEVEILAVVEEEGDTWMTPIFEYLTEETLPADVKKARAVRRKSQRFAIINGTLYKKSFLGPWLRFGLPEEIISDNGKQFRDNLFKDWCEKLCIRQHFAYVKHPQTNGLVERANRSLGKGIKARLDARSKNWMEELSHVLSHPAEIGMPTLKTMEVDLVQNNEALEINLDLLEEKREQAAIHEAKSKAKMEKYYNSKVRSTSFKPGDLVYRNNDASRTEDTGKLGPKWEGPYEVTEALENGAYKLRDHDGKQLPRT